MQLELKGETVAYCFFFFLFLCFFLVFLWEISQWDRKWEGIKEKLSWRLRIWLRRGEREREREFWLERERDKRIEEERSWKLKLARKWFWHQNWLVMYHLLWILLLIEVLHNFEWNSQIFQVRVFSQDLE